ncbi:hypothetical protein LTR62_000280 [Meristemomyces frigidus]|uniref:UBC core domain-containing protein n=1 Tax=Meristemomyces frigidus TaxID=1508187 RepID=A0AAN7TSM0_9PEZI|nr:hypothetical protein LTR62_000280 [Meristemomyces frigidus]
MSTTGQFSSKNPTIKRILKEASELANQPSSEYHAAPLETDLFEWHFTIRGPPSPSPFEGGLYHGRIILPPAYPLKPPSFRFLTSTGRFEVNREICLSISGHHEETWQPAWGIRTALVAIRSFMDTSASGQLGGMEASDDVRRRMAAQSPGFKCAACAKSNSEIMREQDEVVKEAGGDGKKEEVVPEELRLAYREQLGEKKGEGDAGKAQAPLGSNVPVTEQQKSLQSATTAASASGSTAQSPAPSVPVATGTQPQGQPQTQQQQRAAEEALPPWIDKAIWGIVAALAIVLFRMWLF